MFAGIRADCIIERRCGPQLPHPRSRRALYGDGEKIEVAICLDCHTGGVLLGAGLSGTIMSLVEQPAYTVARSFEDVEIRDYPPMVVAEVEVTGERKAAINAGFRQIADYIFGNNSPAQKIPMTAPVTQQAGEKIAMTAPVTQQSAGGSWKVRFIMPSSYTMDVLPRPNNPSVKLVSLPAERFAAIRFSGLAGDEAIARFKQRLLDRLPSRGLRRKAT